jgi:hypothetical protein
MVDKPKRMAAAKVIEDFLSCRTTNFDYSHRYPRSDDLVLFAIYSMLWSACADDVEHRMDGKHALSVKGRQLMDHCILFLRTAPLWSPALLLLNTSHRSRPLSYCSRFPPSSTLQLVRTLGLCPSRFGCIPGDLSPFFRRQTLHSGFG